MSPELKLLSTAVTECGSGSLFVHSTVVPSGTSMRGLRYARFLIPVRETRAGSLRRAGAAGGRRGAPTDAAAVSARVTGGRAAVSTRMTGDGIESARAPRTGIVTVSTRASRTVSTRTTVSVTGPSATTVSATRLPKYR